MMNLKKVFISFGLAIVMMAAIGRTVFAEEAAVTPADETLITSSQLSPMQKEGDMQWVWGEVIKLDIQTSTLTLKYLDYDTDQEQEMVLAADEKTIFENIKDFSELKLNDTLSIDYMIGSDNRSIARNISFENPDTASVPVPVETEVSELAQPTEQLETPVDSSIEENGVPEAVESIPASEDYAEPVPAVQGQVQ